MNALTNQLENCGLKLKPQKCRAVHLLKHGTTDEMYVATKTVIRVAGSQIPNLGLVGSIDLDLLLEQVETCWLKPQHKIEVIRKKRAADSSIRGHLG